MSEVLEISETQIETAIGRLDGWAHQCHAASLALVKSGLLGPRARVARGTCAGVGGQHSWAIIGDCYDETATVVDVTAWSYDPARPRVWVTSYAEGSHRPHGLGSIFGYGKPSSHGGEPIVLEGLGLAGKAFMEMLGPLDLRGWLELLNAPVQGWPAREIIAAAYADRRLAPMIPIDIVGMLTDANPEGLYR